MKYRLILITGGARSGKSFLGESLAQELNTCLGGQKPVAYIATAEAMDGEFRRRIELHRQRRGDGFTTVEEPIAIDKTVQKTLVRHRVLLLECATTWLGNVFHKMMDTDIESFLDKTLKNLANILEKNNYPVKTDYGSMIQSEDRVSGKPFQALNKLVDGADGVLIVVSNELGLGIVPADRKSREYRDLHGIMNARLAAMADAVYFTVSGIPLRLK